MLPDFDSKELEIKKLLRRNTLTTGLSILAGFSLLIPAFSLHGSKFDYQLFCFKPESIPSDQTYCTGDKKKRGLAWRIAVEREESAKFKEKVTLLDFVPAKNPHAGLFGLGGTALIIGGFIASKLATNRLEDDLDILVANKQIILVERDLEQQKHLNLKTHQSLLQEDYLKSQLDRSFGEQKYYEMSEGERELAAREQLKIEELNNANFDLQLTAINSQSTKEKVDIAENQAKIDKLNKTNSKSAPNSDSNQSNAERLEELKKLLKEHEDGWLYTLCTTRKVLLIEGEQGSFKSYTAALIAYLRYQFKEHKLGWIVDSDYHQNQTKSWKILQSLDFESYGSHKNGEGIREGLERFLDGIQTRDEDSSQIETLIFDELTTYGSYEECEQVARDFMKFALSAPRKAAYGLIGITHSMTNEGTGKGGGMAAARKRGTLHLLLQADNDYNPLFKGTLNGYKVDGELKEDLPITLPEWFRPDTILRLLGR
ncbi:MAG: hypothetical protein WA919_06465 [Coleofasciculaceae cyanobacterium]